MKHMLAVLLRGFGYAIATLALLGMIGLNGIQILDNALSNQPFWSTDNTTITIVGLVLMIGMTVMTDWLSGLLDTP